jgi:hypothetical protein
MRRAFFHLAHEFGDAQRIGQPFKLDAVSLLKFEQPLVGDVGVGALVVGVDSDTRCGHRRSPFERQAILPDPNGGRNPHRFN